eukprot:SM000158S02029  [mRNA]  locus=s158:143577:144867:- [translate_table: standard]
MHRRSAALQHAHASLLSLLQDAGSGDDGGGDGGNPASRTWYEIHGWGMWLALGVLFPIGILISGIGQDFMPGWFHLHWILQTAGVLIMIAAYVIAVSLFDAWDSNHSYIGTAVFVAILVNWAAGFVLRPKRGSVLRALWYPVHFFVGTSAVLLGWYNLTLGFRLYQDQYSRNHGLWIALLTQDLDYHYPAVTCAQLGVTGMVYLLLSRLPRWRLQTVPPEVGHNTYGSSAMNGNHATNGNGNYMEQGPDTMPMQDLRYKRPADQVAAV